MNLVEQYLYSLPEYRIELHQRNFIEIRSFNGLLATKKVIGLLVTVTHLLSYRIFLTTQAYHRIYSVQTEADYILSNFKDTFLRHM